MIFMSALSSLSQICEDESISTSLSLSLSFRLSQRHKDPHISLTFTHSLSLFLSLSQDRSHCPSLAPMADVIKHFLEECRFLPKIQKFKKSLFQCHYLPNVVHKVARQSRFYKKRYTLKLSTFCFQNCLFMLFQLRIKSRFSRFHPKIVL